MIQIVYESQHLFFNFLLYSYILNDWKSIKKLLNMSKQEKETKIKKFSKSSLKIILKFGTTNIFLNIFQKDKKNCRNYGSQFGIFDRSPCNTLENPIFS